MSDQLEGATQQMDKINGYIEKSCETPGPDTVSLLATVALASASGLVGVYVSRFVTGTGAQIAVGVLTAILLYAVVGSVIARLRR